MSSSKKITLKRSDDEAVALKSPAIKKMTEDDYAENGIPFPNLTGKILAKVIKYCKNHVEGANPEDRNSEYHLKTWDSEFVEVEQDSLFDLILAANYLNIKNLQDLTCQTLVEMVKGKMPKEIHKMYNIKNDFTLEEAEEVHRETQWLFERCIGR